MFAFDKTGTLTEGNLKLFDVIAYNGATKTDIINIAASLESLSEHPIGKTIVEHAKEMHSIEAFEAWLNTNNIKHRFKSL